MQNACGIAHQRGESNTTSSLYAMTKPRVSASKPTPRRSEPSDVEASAASKEKARTLPKRDADAVQARERARQRAGADD